MTSHDDRPPAARLRPRDLWLILAAGALSRFIVATAGRTTVEDGFYLRNAFAWARGDAPYEDFSHVAFPFVEALYAPFLVASDRPLLAASLVTGAATILTALLVATLLARVAGRGAAVAGALLYLFAAPVLAFHAFERELWSNLGLAAGALVLWGTPRPTDGRAAWGGLLLAAAATAKLTAAIGVVAVLIELIRRRNARAAAIAAGFAGGALLAATLLLTARYGEEFLVQVFLFFFFKGAATDLAGRGLVFLQHIDPTLALGLVGAAVATFRRDPVGRPAALLLGAWLAYYAFASSSFWNHNTLDLALPAALSGGALVAGFARRPRPVVLVAVTALLFPSLGLNEPLRPTWFPHGFGGGGEANDSRSSAESDFLRQASTPDEFVLAASPTVGLRAGRVSFVGDYEVEPVVRALLVEVRRRGLGAAWARRDRGETLGAPPGRPEPPPLESLFVGRMVRAVFLHLVPRLHDAVRAGEIAAALEPMPPPIAEALVAEGLVPTPVGAGRGYRR